MISFSTAQTEKKNCGKNQCYKLVKTCDINMFFIFFLIFQATASRLSNGHINFAKARNLAQKLKEFAIWKDVESPYAKTPVVAEFLQNSPIWSEKGMLTRAQS